MKRLAIISPNKFKYSETFIHAHVCELPFEKVLLHTGYLPGFMSDGLEGADVSLAEKHGKGWWKREKDAGKLLAKTLKREKIDVVLAEYGPTGVACMDACREAGVPMVVHFHGYDAYREDILGEQGRRYGELFEKSAALVAVSYDMERQLKDLGAPWDKVHFVPYGVDVERFVQVDPSANPPVLVAVGRFTAKKAPRLTVEAFAKALEEVPEAILEMIGEGELLEETRAVAEKMGLGEKVRFKGRLEHEAVASALAGARAFVQHSLRPPDGDSEGLPLAVLEAMATGLPVVATLHAGIPDAVRHGIDGLLSSEQDCMKMAEHMIRLLEDPTLAATLGGQARQRVEHLFTHQRYIAELAALLEESS